MVSSTRYSRRNFLRYFALSGAGVGLLGAGFGVDRIGPALWSQRSIWQVAEASTADFQQQYAAPLARLHFGANLCPDYQLMAAEFEPDQAVRMIKENFGCQHVRLGMRWSTHAAQGIDAYDRWIDALLTHGIKTVVAYGIKAPFPPETHFPPAIEAALPSLGVNHGEMIHAASPLGDMVLDYTQKLLDHLERTFGLANFYGFNPENESDAHYGKHKLAIAPDLLRAHAQLLHHPSQLRRVLLNTALIAPLGVPASLTTVIANALAIQAEFPTIIPFVGADIYEETAAGRIAANLYVDTFAGVQMRHGPSLLPTALQTLRQADIALEVTEFQLSDWIREPRRHQPGSLAHFQYLLARMCDHLVDRNPAPAHDPFIVRLWELSNPLLQMRADPAYFAANPTFRLIRQLNDRMAG